MKYNGSSWALVGTTGLSGGSLFGIDIKIDSSNTPYVFYRDSLNSNGATVKKFVGISPATTTGWDLLGSANFTQSAINSQLALLFDSHDVPHVFGGFGGPEKFFSMKYVGAASTTGWAFDTGSTLSVGRVTHLAAAFNSSDIPYVVYNDDGFLKGAVKRLAILIVPPISTTTAATSVASSTMTLNGGILDTGDEDASRSGFAYSSTSPTLTANVSTSTLGAQTGLASFSQNIVGLTPGNVYYFRAYAYNSAGTSTGAIYSTTTLALARPIATTSVPTLVATSTMTFNGAITYTGNLDATQSGFAYGTTANLTTGVSTTTLGGQSGVASFSQAITGLLPGTTYYFRAYAYNSIGTSTSALIVSTSTIAVSAPTVSTQAVSSIDQTSATGNGTIVTTGNINSTSIGVVYGLSNTYGATTTTSGDFGIATFTSYITGLICNTLYHVAAYASSTVGLGYGSDVTFTTNACTVTPISGGGSSGSSSGSRGRVTVVPPLHPNNTPDTGDFSTTTSGTQPLSDDKNPPVVQSQTDDEADSFESSKETSSSLPGSSVRQPTKGSTTRTETTETNDASDTTNLTETKGFGIGSIASFISTSFGKLASLTEEIAVSTAGDVAKVAGLVIPASVLLLGSISRKSSWTFGDIILETRRAWGLLLTFLGLRKRRKSWGTVYDSVTKRPLDPACVTAIDELGKEVSDSITDLDGRYGFLLPPGTYTLRAEKTNYLFPSKRMGGVQIDEMYVGLYYGAPITVKSGQVIELNIPMDPLAFDWNEFAKEKQLLSNFHAPNERTSAFIQGIFFFAGIVLTIFSIINSPTTFNFIILIAYILLSLFYVFGSKGRSSGTVRDVRTGQPLSFSLIKVYGSDKSTIIKSVVADAEGRYYCLVPPGDFTVEIEKKNLDESYTKVYSRRVSTNQKGIINEKFEV